MSAPTSNITQSTQVGSVPATRSQEQVLCVDLDGSLIATDVLWESLLVLLKLQPWILFAFPFWFLQGRAAFKRRIAERVILDPGSLPYRHDVLSFLREEKERGRTLVLATASDYQPAEGIAVHLGFFSEVLASDGVINLSGQQKQQALVARFGEQGFDYIGDSSKDLPVWASAKRALLVDPSSHVLQNATNLAHVTNVFRRQSHSLRNIVSALRIGQWVKNVLVFLPLLAAHRFVQWESVRLTTWAFLAFCLCASSIYILNDLLDLPADRRHPKKKFRPFASGVLSIRYGLALSPALFLCAVSIAMATLPSSFLSLLILYVITTDWVFGILQASRYSRCTHPRIPLLIESPRWRIRDRCPDIRLAVGVFDVPLFESGLHEETSGTSLPKSREETGAGATGLPRSR